MKKLLFMVIFLPMSLFSAPVEFWTCKFADGYDMNDLNKWVVKWNKNLDDNLEEQSYSAYVMTPSFSSNLWMLILYGLEVGQILLQWEQGLKNILEKMQKV